MLDRMALLNEVKREEGEKKSNGLHIAYYDSLGKLTLGHGTLIESPGGIPDHIADDLLNWKLDAVMLEMDNHMLWWRGESDMRKRALVNAAYNMGVSGLLKFQKTLWLMQHGNYKAAAQEFLNSKYAKQVPKRAERLAKMIRDGYEN